MITTTQAMMRRAVSRCSNSMACIGASGAARSTGAVTATGTATAPRPMSLPTTSSYARATPLTIHARSLATQVASVAKTSKDTNEPTVTLEKGEKGVYILRLNRPSSLNAMTLQMGHDFLETINQLCTDPEIRVLVLTGAGRAFSAGGDLEFLLSRCDDTPHSNSQEMRAFYGRFLSLLQLPVPIIAAINGPAIGAGLCVAAACDLRVTARDVDLGFTFTRIGLHPGMGCTHFLPAIIGQQHASRLLLTGEIIKGSRAHEIGLVGEVVDQPADVLPAALKLANSIASNSPVAIRTLTTSLRMRHQDNLERALYREADAQAQSYGTSELRENVTAIMNKTANRNKQRS